MEGFQQRSAKQTSFKTPLAMCFFPKPLYLAITRQTGFRVKKEGKQKRSASKRGGSKLKGQEINLHREGSNTAGPATAAGGALKMYAGKTTTAEEVVHRQRLGIAGKTILPHLQPN